MKKASIFCILALVKCIIPLGEHVMIVSAEDPSYELTMEDQVVRLKNTGIIEHKPGDPNLLELYIKHEAYHIKFLRRSLYKKQGVNEIMGEHFRENDQGFRFDIVTTNEGLQIKINNLCLTAGEFDDTYEGYTVEATPCVHEKLQKFIIKRVPLLVKDNRNPMSNIIEFDRGRRFIRSGCLESL